MKSNNSILKHIGFWLLFFLGQSFLFGGGTFDSFYFVKNIAIVSLQALAVYLNLLFLIPHLLVKKKYLLYVAVVVIGLYLIYAISFDAIGVCFSIFFPDTTRGGVVDGNWWPSEFWNILAGSAPYAIVLLASTIFYLLSENKEKLSGLNDASNRNLDPLGNQLLEDSNPKNDTILLKEGKVIHRLETKDIFYVQGMKEYVSWKTRDKKLITLHSLANLEALLANKGFIRTHKSYIINAKLVSAIRYDSVEVEGKRIPIGRSYRTRVQNAFQSDFSLKG